MNRHGEVSEPRLPRDIQQLETGNLRETLTQ